MRQLGLDASRAPAPPLPAIANGSAAANGCSAANGTHEPEAKKARLDVPAAGSGAGRQHPAHLPTAIVLDIEGTVSPISYVTDTLFPYAKARLRSHLEATFGSEETQADLDLLRQQVGFGTGAGGWGEAAALVGREGRAMWSLGVAQGCKRTAGTGCRQAESCRRAVPWAF